jgi:hypothetical protein
VAAAVLGQRGLGGEDAREHGREDQASLVHAVAWRPHPG